MYWYFGFPGGAVGQLTLDTGSQAADPGAGVTIDGSEGRLSFGPYGDRIAVETRLTRRIERLREGGLGTGPMIAEFVRCIADDRDPVVTGEAGLNDLEVVLAAYRSRAGYAGLAPAPLIPAVPGTDRRPGRGACPTTKPGGNVYPTTKCHPEPTDYVTPSGARGLGWWVEAARYAARPNQPVNSGYLRKSFRKRSS